MDGNTFRHCRNLAIAVGTLVLAAVTAYFTHNFQRRINLESNHRRPGPRRKPK